MIALSILGGVVTVGFAAFMLLGRSQTLATGRWGRMARTGRMSARLSTSFLGIKLRRLLSSKKRRVRYTEARRKADAEYVANTMGEMKGAFMKLGQMMSFVSDAVPPEFRKALQSLQASAPPMDFALLRDVAERELGQPLERVFARFDEQPIAAASIGQVHRARLANGDEVAVKIQYPGVADAIGSDLKNAGMLTRMAKMMYPSLDPVPVIEELRERITEELDYEHEAQNQSAFAELYKDHPYIHVPRVYQEHSTSMVLTSEFIKGRPFEELYSADIDAKNRYGEILYRFVFGSIIRFGVFNGDPHPGNYLLGDDGRLVFLDFGCVKYFPESMLGNWRDLIKAHMAGKAERFREQAVALDFLKSGAPIDAQKIFDYFCFFYEPFDKDRIYEFTPRYTSRSFGMVFSPGGPFSGMQKSLNMPKDFVFVNRIQWGVYSILGQLGSTQNWHRIHREFVFREPPQSELGKLDATWLVERGLHEQEVILRSDGIRLREASS